MSDGVPSTRLAFTSLVSRICDHCLEVNLLPYEVTTIKLTTTTHIDLIKLPQTQLHCEHWKPTTSMSHPLQVSATAGKADFSRPINVSALKGKSVLVTGGASGLGAAFVRGFAEAGYVWQTGAPTGTIVFCQLAARDTDTNGMAGPMWQLQISKRN